MSHIVKHQEIDVLVNFEHRFSTVPVNRNPTFGGFGIVEKVQNRRAQAAPGKSDCTRGGGRGNPKHARIPSEPAVREPGETGGVRGGFTKESRKRKDSTDLTGSRVRRASG